MIAIDSTIKQYLSGLFFCNIDLVDPVKLELD